MKMVLRRILIVFGTVLVSGSLALAQMRGAEQPSPASNNPELNPDQQQRQQNAAFGTMQDKDFVHSALQGGMAEVQLGQLATQKGASDDVKQFGQKMVDDHTRLDGEMQQVAQQIGVSAPRGLSKKDKALVAKLQSLSGTEFDDAYIEAMVKDHKNDLMDFRQEVANSQNPTVKQAAQQGQQMIDEHLQLIDQIAKAHNLKD